MWHVFGLSELGAGRRPASWPRASLNLECGQGARRTPLLLYQRERLQWADAVIGKPPPLFFPKPRLSIFLARLLVGLVVIKSAGSSVSLI